MMAEPSVGYSSGTGAVWPAKNPFVPCDAKSSEARALLSALADELYRRAQGIDEGSSDIAAAAARALRQSSEACRAVIADKDKG
jgi:hypothetical protein